jgi:hypothetical protein
MIALYLWSGSALATLDARAEVVIDRRIMGKGNGLKG